MCVTNTLSSVVTRFQASPNPQMTSFHLVCRRTTLFHTLPAFPLHHTISTIIMTAFPSSRREQFWNINFGTASPFRFQGSDSPPPPPSIPNIHPKYVTHLFHYIQISKFGRVIQNINFIHKWFLQLSDRLIWGDLQISSTLATSQISFAYSCT